MLALPLAACSSTLEVPAPPVWPLRADDLEANGQDRDCDLLHLTLDVTVDFEGRRVYGTATSWVRALRQETAAVRLHGVGLEVRAVEDSRGRELAFEVAEPWITVTLQEPLARGEEEKLRVAYAARPQAGMHFRETTKYADGFEPQVWTRGQPEENRHWFPAWDYPNDRATFEARIRVGHDMAAVSNGELLDVQVHGGGERTFHWRMKDDLPTYLFGFAAGRWETYEDEWRGIPLRYHVGPGTGEQRARLALGETPAIVQFFGDLLDWPYPYVKYDQAVVTGFSGGGMETATITVLGDDVLGDPGELADRDGDPRMLVAHEVAHHWFGNLVTCFGWSNLWLNEAFASYLELLYERHVTDEGNFALWLERYREWYLVLGEATRHPLALDWRTQASAPRRANHLYDKGPWVLYMLERELGSEPFRDAVRAYVRRHANGLVDTHDFARSVFDVTGRNVEGFLEQWVYAGGHPVLEAELEVPEGRRKKERPVLDLSVRQAQDFDHLVPLFDVPLDVDLHFADGSRERHSLRVREERERFRLELPGELVDVVVDPDCTLLADLRVAKPLPMWTHQARLAATPAAQWRALPALRAAAEDDNEAAVTLMRLVVESPQPLLRQRAARLCDFDDLRARRALSLAAAQDPEARVRREAAHCLLQHAARQQFEPGTEEYEAFLIRMQVEPSPAVRAKLAEILQVQPVGGGVGTLSATTPPAPPSPPASPPAPRTRARARSAPARTSGSSRAARPRSASSAAPPAGAARATGARTAPRPRAPCGARRGGGPGRGRGARAARSPTSTAAPARGWRRSRPFRRRGRRARGRAARRGGRGRRCPRTSG